ncbi:uncharacterized protein LOC123550279 [Mercenaria mercenaria]|uniref:uncharacterized protein LOC123550279 n=1 Tax=Mercenaria mercenaria TaxID=6596 RepID=UPI00234E9882|nr:uncharacterized protein LOC123550279 [Mercenaria mercenaria]
MATVDVTAEEIEGAPLLINSTVKEIKPVTRSRLNLLLCIVLAVNTSFQLIAIVTPGWNVLRGDITSSYESVYYTIACADTTPLENISTTVCNTITFLDDFSETYNSAKDTLKPALVSVYNLRVRNQINIQFSWFIVAGATIFQVIRYIRTNKGYPRITAINAMGLICACLAMYQSLYEAIVKIDLTSRQAEYISMEVGVPYSVVLYLIAFVQTCACTIIVLKQLNDYIRHIQLALKETKVQVDTLQIKYDAEVEEFRHYRHLHSDKNHLRGRSRKSHRINRGSQRGDNRQRQSTKVREHNDHSPKRTGNKHGARHSEQLERSHARSSRKRDRARETKDRHNHRRDHSQGTSDFSVTSRDSSLDARNHLQSNHEPSRESVQLTSQQHVSTGQADSNPDKQMQESCDKTSKWEGHSEAITANIEMSTEELKGTNSKSKKTSDVLRDEQQMTNNLNTRKQVNVTEEKQEIKLKDCANKDIISQTDNAARTIFAEVHIPSIDGVEIKD